MIAFVLHRPLHSRLCLHVHVFLRLFVLGSISVYWGMFRSNTLIYLFGFVGYALNCFHSLFWGCQP